MASGDQYSYTNSNLSRRDLLYRLGLLAGGSALGSFAQACGGTTSPKSLRTVNFWGTGTLDIGEGWKRLEKDLSIRVQFEDNQNDPGPVITRLVRKNEAQVRHISGLQGGAEHELAQAGAIIPWDVKLIPNFNKLWSWARDIKYTSVGNDRFGIPAVVNADSMIYLPEFVPKIDSYAAVFDPQFKGRTSMEDAWINSVIFTAIYLKENNLEKVEIRAILPRVSLEA